ncbi:hypothetical protein GF376_03310, partial [Candidatus Peregrinibacteria bacterium]|nr:hypothetical protein [Candidatus Peregrinibacteria bacterium]
MNNGGDKYFADIIAQLKVVKKAENIEVPKKFQDSLREELIKRSKNSEEGGVFEFADFFAKWKYLIAAVPTLAVVALVAANFSNLSVIFDAPEITPVQNQAISQENRPVDQIKTFSPAEVMPPQEVIDQYFESLK